MFLFLFQIDGLAALILCSGVVVAAGNEPFKLGNYGFHRIGQITQAMVADTGMESGLEPKTREWSHDCNSFCKIRAQNIQIYLEIDTCYVQRPAVSQKSSSLCKLEACGRAVVTGSVLSKRI